MSGRKYGTWKSSNGEDRNKTTGTGPRVVKDPAKFSAGVYIVFAQMDVCSHTYPWARSSWRLIFDSAGRRHWRHPRTRIWVFDGGWGVAPRRCRQHLDSCRIQRGRKGLAQTDVYDYLHYFFSSSNFHWLVLSLLYCALGAIKELPRAV